MQLVEPIGGLLNAGPRVSNSLSDTKLSRSKSLIGTRKMSNKRVGLTKKERVMGDRIRFYQYFKKWRDYDFMSSIMAAFGLIFAIVQFEMGIMNDREPLNINKDPNPIDHTRHSHVCRFLVFSTSIASVCFLYLAQKYKRIWLSRYLLDKSVEPNEIHYLSVS